MITIKISDLLNSTDALSKLAKINLKARPAFYASKLIKAADAEIQEFNDTRLNLIKKYGEKDENGELITDDKGNCKIMPDSVSTFQQELKELIDVEIELNVDKIKIEDIENIELTPEDMTILEKFINFEDD